MRFESLFDSVAMWTSSVLTNLISPRNSSTGTSAADSIKYSVISGDVKGHLSRSIYLPLDLEDTVSCFCRWVFSTEKSHFAEGNETLSSHSLALRYFIDNVSCRWLYKNVSEPQLNESSCCAVIRGTRGTERLIDIGGNVRVWCEECIGIVQGTSTHIAVRCWGTGAIAARAGWCCWRCCSWSSSCNGDGPREEWF